MMRCDDLAATAAFVVHSPVRWDAAWQRPQEIFSRLARTCDVLYVERPVFLDDVRRPALDCTEPMPGIHRIVPRLPVMYATIEHAAQMMVRTLLLEWIDANAECRARFESPIQWYGTATPAPVMLDAFDARAIVYDRVTDEDLEDQTRERRRRRASLRATRNSSHRYTSSTMPRRTIAARACGHCLQYGSDALRKDAGVLGTDGRGDAVPRPPALQNRLTTVSAYVRLTSRTGARCIARRPVQCPSCRGDPGCACVVVSATSADSGDADRSRARSAQCCPHAGTTPT